MTEMPATAPTPLPDASDKRVSSRTGTDRDVVPRSRRPYKSPTRSHLEGHTTKRYDLQGDACRTVSHLRQILNQKGIPAEATATFADSSLTLEWDE